MGHIIHAWSQSKPMKKSVDEDDVYQKKFDKNGKETEDTREKHETSFSYMLAFWKTENLIKTN